MDPREVQGVACRRRVGAVHRVRERRCQVNDGEKDQPLEDLQLHDGSRRQLGEHMEVLEGKPVQRLQDCQGRPLKQAMMHHVAQENPQLPAEEATAAEDLRDGQVESPRPSRSVVQEQPVPVKANANRLKLSGSLDVLVGVNTNGVQGIRDALQGVIDVSA
jgi:hypothetical protein